MKLAVGGWQGWRRWWSTRRCAPSWSSTRRTSPSHPSRCSTESATGAPETPHANIPSACSRFCAFGRSNAARATAAAGFEPAAESAAPRTPQKPVPGSAAREEAAAGLAAFRSPARTVRRWQKSLLRKSAGSEAWRCFCAAAGQRRDGGAVVGVVVVLAVRRAAPPLPARRRGLGLAPEPDAPVRL